MAKGGYRIDTKNAVHIEGTIWAMEKAMGRQVRTVRQRFYRFQALNVWTKKPFGWNRGSKKDFEILITNVVLTKLFFF